MTCAPVDIRKRETERRERNKDRDERGEDHTTAADTTPLLLLQAWIVSLPFTTRGNTRGFELSRKKKEREKENPNTTKGYPRQSTVLVVFTRCIDCCVQEHRGSKETQQDSEADGRKQREGGGKIG